jgi:hypothetical protein
MTPFTLEADDALLVREDLRGAPFAIGVMVDVVGCRDETGDERFCGQRGTVTGLLYDDPLAQVPFEPLVLVRVDGLGEELFFPSELRSTVRA